MKAMTESAIHAMLRTGERAAVGRSADASRRPLSIVREPKGVSLTALVREVYRSYKWENVLWITLGLSSLVLLALSFLI